MGTANREKLLYTTSAVSRQACACPTSSAFFSTYGLDAK